MASVFLNYRRQDSSGYAGRIFDRLVAKFGKEQIFRDIDRIEPGLDFTEVIDQSLKSCVAVLVLIGPKWLELKNENGEPRLHEPVDYVRFEIEQALERGVRVIPVLVPGMRDIPSAGQLPESIAQLSKLHAFRLTEESWDAELNKLNELLIKLGLRTIEPKPVPPRKNSLVNRVLMGLGVLFVVGMIAAVFVDEEPFPTPLPPQPFVPNPTPSPAPVVYNEPELPSNHENISAAQRALSTLGYYDGMVDGITGPRTVGALRDYQSDEDLTEDGRLTASLLTKLVQQAPPLPVQQQAQASLSGTWYDNYANRYEVRQSGNQVTARAYAATGEYLGDFEGTLSGKQLSYSYDTVLGTSGNGVGMLQPDNRHLNTVASDYGSGTSESNQLHRGHLPQ